MNGDISLESQLGLGTTFRIKLKTDVANKESYSAKEPQSPHINANYSAILGDLNTESRQFLIKKLKRHQIQVRLANSGKQIIDFYREEKKCNLVILNPNYEDYETIYLVQELRDIQACKIEKSADQDIKNTYLYIVLLNNSLQEMERIKSITNKIDEMLIRPLNTQIVKEITKKIEIEKEKLQRVDTQIEEKAVLIVDDDPFTIQFYENVFNFLGFKKLITAINGKQAIEEFQKNFGNIKFIIMDYEMPFISGIEAAYLIRQYEKSKNQIQFVPIIICSGNEGEFYEQQAKNVDAVFMIKPVSTQKLGELFEEYKII